MTSRVPPGGFESEPAESSSVRPSGMSLGEWLSTRTRQSEPPAGERRAFDRPASGPADISEIHRQLDTITRQIDQISQGRARPAPNANGLATQLNDAISRLDSRLARLSQGNGQLAAPSQAAATPRSAAFAEPQPAFVPAAPPVAAQPAPPAKAGFDLGSAVAEINARRSELDRGQGLNGVPRQPSPPLAPPVPPSPNLTSLERQLQLITSQMETLRRPDSLDRSIEAFREELAEIRRSLTEAMPRQAILSLEAEIRSLAQRIDHSRDAGGDHDILANIERALNDIYGVVRGLTPAEQLAGYDQAIGKLSDKIDLIVRASPDSGGIQQLQDAITALRGIAANIASNEAIGRLSDTIHALNDKVDRLAATSGGDMLATLEQRIAMLTDAVGNRPQAAADDGSLESAVRALTDRLDRLGGGNDNLAGMAEIESRISHLVERLETTEPRFNNSSRVEESLTEILRHLDYQRQVIAGLGDQLSTPAAAPDALAGGIVDSIKRELSDVRGHQAENDRRTQDTLEAVHSTLSHVVDRLSMIEGDLKRVQSAPLQLAMAPTPFAAALFATAPAMPAAARTTEHIRPELPNPVAARPVAAEPRGGAAVDAVTETRAAASTPDAAGAARRSPNQRPPIDPSLPPDYPLEPGARLAPERASLAGAVDATAKTPDAASTSNFIAAARRAAQAAAAASAAQDKPSRITVTSEAARSAAGKVRSAIRSSRSSGAEAKLAAGPATKASKTRAVVVGVSVAVIVFGGFRLVMNHVTGGDDTAAEHSTTVEPAPADKPATDTPTTTAPAAMPPAERQSLTVPAPAAPAPNPAPDAPTSAKSSDLAPPPANGTLSASADVTGSLTAPAEANAPVATPDGADKVPSGMASPGLRAAALRGEPAAAFEVAVRFAEGKGTPVNFVEAAKWYERAAAKGIVPAMFRLGTILEKGSNGKKDIDAARRYYVLAADRGNAKAMHNLAVLDADGGGKGPNYQSAAVWFRKAAERGVADSQYNLGILYARGIGVEQNLAESYKWFSLAAAQGDADGSRKRDDVAKRLDPQSLAAAKLAIQTFTPEPQPDDAINVAAPAGGWDNYPVTSAAKPAMKPVATKPARQRDAAR